MNTCLLFKIFIQTNCLLNKNYSVTFVEQWIGIFKTELPLCNNFNNRKFHDFSYAIRTGIVCYLRLFISDFSVQFVEPKKGQFNPSGLFGRKMVIPGHRLKKEVLRVHNLPLSLMICIFICIFQHLVCKCTARSSKLNFCESL